MKNWLLLCSDRRWKLWHYDAYSRGFINTMLIIGSRCCDDFWKEWNRKVCFQNPLFAMQLICVAELPFLRVIRKQFALLSIWQIPKSRIKYLRKPLSWRSREFSIAAASLIGNFSAGKIAGCTLKLAILILQCTFSEIPNFQGYVRTKSQKDCWYSKQFSFFAVLSLHVKLCTRCARG